MNQRWRLLASSGCCPAGRSGCFWPGQGSATEPWRVVAAIVSGSPQGQARLGPATPPSHAAAMAASCDYVASGRVTAVDNLDRRPHAVIEAVTLNSITRPAPAGLTLPGPLAPELINTLKTTRDQLRPSNPPKNNPPLWASCDLLFHLLLIGSLTILSAARSSSQPRSWPAMQFGKTKARFCPWRPKPASKFR